MLAHDGTCHDAAGAMLAGTHMQFASAGASERADPAIVAAGGGSPGGGGPAVEYVEDWGTHSTVALEAALGACREKALELELRLRSAEQRIQSQVRMIEISKRPHGRSFMDGQYLFCRCGGTDVRNDGEKR